MLSFFLRKGVYPSNPSLPFASLLRPPPPISVLKNYSRTVSFLCLLILKLFFQIDSYNISPLCPQPFVSKSLNGTRVGKSVPFVPSFWVWGFTKKLLLYAVCGEKSNQRRQKSRLTMALWCVIWDYPPPEENVSCGWLWGRLAMWGARRAPSFRCFVVRLSPFDGISTLLKVWRGYIPLGDFTGCFAYKLVWSPPAFAHTISSPLLISSNQSLSVCFCNMNSTTDKGKSIMVDEVLSPPSANPTQGIPSLVEKVLPEEVHTSKDGAKKKSGGSGRGPRRPSINLDRLQGLAGGVQSNISMLHTTSLFGTIIGDPVEAKIIRKKIKFAWKLLSKGFQLIPLASNWFELRFDLAADCEHVWLGRPYHLLGRLLLLKQWRENFDPTSEPITTLDMWVRFPGLPAKYISDDVLTNIAVKNDLGSVLRVAAYNEKGARLRYPRVCVSVDITQISSRTVMVVNEKGVAESYPLWLEDFPTGCGCCGEADHLFPSCPKRQLCSSGLGGGRSSSAHPDATNNNQATPPENGEGWQEVPPRRPLSLPPPSFGHPKESLLQLFGSKARSPSVSSASMDSEKSDEISTTLGAGTEEAVGSEPSHPVEMGVQSTGVEMAYLPNDVNQPTVDSPIAVIDALDGDEQEILEDVSMEEGFDDAMAEFSQEDFDKMLSNVPPSCEFILPNLSNPSRLTTALASTAAPASPRQVEAQFEQLGVNASSNSESSKRKSGIGEEDTASSALKGGKVKRVRYDV